MRAPYPGPLRDEPVAVELHNTIYAMGGELMDGLATSASADEWLIGISDRLPAGGMGGGPNLGELIDLRGAVREVLRAVVDGTIPRRASVDVLNRCSVRARRARIAGWRTGSPPVGAWDYGRATRADVVLSAIAADTIRLLTGPEAADLRSCGAPGCVLMFVKGRTRREWCSGSCGNRARQARHYRRVRDRAPDVGDQ